MNTSADNFDLDIAIIGGGMVGITAALLLAQRLPHLRIGLLEQYDLSPRAQPFQPSFDQRATAIAAGSFEALAWLGLESALATVSGAIKSVQVSDKGHWGKLCIQAEDYQLDNVGLVVPNAALGQCLLEKLCASPVQKLAPVSVQKLTPLSPGYAIELADSRVRARLVLLADGTDECLKKSLGLGQKRTDYGQLAVIANLQLEQPHHNRACERFTAKGPMALLPLADPHQCALVWTLPAAQQALAAADDAEFLQAVQQQFGYSRGNFIRAGRRDCYPLALIEAREPVRSHLALLGNAAHFLHPVAGQGFNLSVRDLLVLADCLARNLREGGIERLGELTWLQAYQDERAQDQWLTIQYSHQLVSWFSSDRWYHYLPRQLGLLAVKALPQLKHWLAEQSMGRELGAHPIGRIL